MKRNSTELKVKYHGNKDKPIRKKNPNASVSELGYRDDSPYRSLPYIDIYTPNGSIDMSGTGIPLWANGRILPPYSGIHRFDTETVREIPLAKTGGPLPKAQDGKSVLTAPGVYQELPEGMTEEEFIDYLKSNNEYFGDVTQQDYDKRKAYLFNKYYGQVEPYDIDPNTRERAKGFDYYYTDVPDMQQVDKNTRSDLINKMQNFMQYASGPRATQNQNAFTNTLEEIDRALRFENNKLKVNQDLTPQKPFGYGMSEYRKGGWLDQYQVPPGEKKSAYNDTKENLVKLEQKLSEELGRPHFKAANLAVEGTDPWGDRFTDSKRHAGAGFYTNKGIQNLFPDWAKYTGFPQWAGFVGSNALGVGHELTNWDWKTSGEDIYNNLIGSAIGSVADEKSGRQLIKNLAENETLMPGYVPEPFEVPAIRNPNNPNEIIPFDVLPEIIITPQGGRRAEPSRATLNTVLLPGPGPNKNKKTGGSKLPPHLPEAYKTGGNWLDNYQSGGPTVRELWESATGKPWSAAKESGLTTGTYDDNKALKKRIMAGEFGKVKASTPAPVTVAPAKVVRPVSPLYMQALNQSNRQAGARDATSTLGEQQRRAANMGVKVPKRDDTKAAPEGSVRSYVQKGVDYLEKMAKLSSAMNRSGTGWATELGTSFITSPVQSGLNISNTVMGDRPIRNDSDILDLGIDVANVLPFAAEAVSPLKSAAKVAKNIKQEAFYRGIDPLGYGAKKKIIDFVPNLYKNTVRPAERAKRIGAKLTDLTHHKAVERIGKNRLDAWRVGLGLDQQYNTFTKLKDGTYKIKNTKQFNPEFFQSLQRELNLSKRKSPNQVLIVENAKDPGFKKSIYMNDQQYGIKGGYRWDVGKTDDGLLHFRSNDTWDLHPWKRRGAVEMEQVGDNILWDAILSKHRKPLLENVEMLGVMGGKPYNISNNFLVDPKTYQIVKQWKQGGTMKNWLDKYQGDKKKSQTGLSQEQLRYLSQFSVAPRPETDGSYIVTNDGKIITGNDRNQSILQPAEEKSWLDTASNLYEGVLDPFTYAGATLDYASDWAKQKMGIKPEGELDPINVRARRQQEKDTATNIPAAVWQLYNKPLWLGNLAQQTGVYGQTGDVGAFAPAITGASVYVGGKLGSAAVKKMISKKDGGESDDESFGPVRKAGIPSVEAGEGMPEVTRTQETESFGEAFKKARASGLKTFTWHGKTFGTKYKSEVETEKKPAPKQSSAQKSSAPPRPMIDMSLRNIPISSKPKTVAQPSVQVPIAKRTAPVAKPAPTYASTPYSVAVTDPYASRVTERVMPTNVPMGRMPAGNISYGYQTAPASTTAVARPTIGPGMQPVGRAPKTLPAKSAKPVSAQLQNQQPENVAADVRDFQNNLMGSMLSKLNQRSNVPMAPGRFQIGSDPRQLPQSGIITDKRTNQQYVKTPSSIYNFPVITARNPDLNANPYEIEYLEAHPELKNTPRGYYTLEDTKTIDGELYSIDTSEDAGNLGRWINPIEAFGMPAPLAKYNAMHGTYMPEYNKRNALYTQSPEKRWASYGCINARECDLKQTFNDIAVGDTSLVLDSKFPEDAVLLEQIKREQMQKRPVMLQKVKKDKYQGNKNKSQTGDPRQLPQTGIVVDKRTGEAYVRTNNSIYNFPVLTGRNPDLNSNPYSVEYLENYPELRNTPTGYYTTYEHSYDKSHSKDYEGGLVRRLKPIPAFGTPAPVSTNVAMHGTYMGDYKNRNPRYNQPADQRYVSYGCVNARECDLKRAFNDIAVGDTTLILDSKNAADAKLLSQLKPQRTVSQTVRRKNGGSAKDWLKNYQ